VSPEKLFSREQKRMKFERVHVRGTARLVSGCIVNETTCKCRVR
jgi:hypothetical protein